MNERIRARMQRQIPGLVALAGDFQVRHAAPRVPEILHLQLAQLVPPQRVIEQRRQDGAVALVLDRVLVGRCQEIAGLVVANRRRFSFAALGPWSLDAFDRVMGNGVPVAEIFEQR